MAKATTKFFELIIGQNDGEVHSGDVPVRWCVSNGLVEQLEEQEERNPHVLLIPVNPDLVAEDGTIRQHGREVGERKLVPMKDLMTYVRFNRPGKNRLLAYIVFGNTKGLKKIFLGKYCGDYTTTLLCEGELSITHRVKGWVYEDQHVDVNIEIPEGVFGKEPAPWRKWYANLWMRGILEDECHFRQRFWLVGTLKFFPVVAVASWFFVARGAIALGMALLGYKKVDWWPVIQPFNNYTRYVTWNCNNEDNFFLNLFTIDRNDHCNVVQSLSSFTGVFVTPLFLLIVALFILLLSVINGFGFWVGLMLMLVTMAGVAVIMGALLGFFILGEKTVEKTTWSTKFGNWGHGWITNFVEWREAREIAANSLDNLPELICPKNQDNVIVAQFSDIPWRRRSIKLWFEATKNMVCRPMAK